MGVELRDLPAWHLVTDAEEILATSLAPLLLGDELKTTQAAQMAVLAALTRVLGNGQGRDRRRVTSFAGHSLGQITALIACGRIQLRNRRAGGRPPRRGHPGSRRSQARRHGRAARRHRRAGRGRRRRHRRLVLGRQPQRPGTDRHRGHARRSRRRQRQPPRPPAFARSCRSTWPPRSTRRSCTKLPTRSPSTSRRSNSAAPSAPIVSNEDGARLHRRRGLANPPRLTTSSSRSAGPTR